jgi:hypothetical protein
MGACPVVPDEYYSLLRLLCPLLLKRTTADIVQSTETVMNQPSMPLANKTEAT